MTACAPARDGWAGERERERERERGGNDWLCPTVRSECGVSHSLSVTLSEYLTSFSCADSVLVGVFGRTGFCVCSCVARSSDGVVGSVDYFRVDGFGVEVLLAVLIAWVAGEREKERERERERQQSLVV